MSGFSVSVALATYNGASFILEQLQSIACQSRLPDQVVVSDDASFDRTLEIVREYSVDCHFKVDVVLGGDNVGYSQNFNRAMQCCKGDYVFLCDQDDVWLPGKIERVMEVFSARPDVVLIIHDLEFCDGNLLPVGQTKIERMTTGYNLERDYVVGMATAIRGDFLRLCLPVPDLPGITHDRWLHDCALAVDKKLVLNEVLALYRRHADNATAGSAINNGFVMNKWALLWERAKGSSRLKMQTSIADSPLAEWLVRQREALISGGYLDNERLEAVLSYEIRRVECMRARQLLLRRSLLPRVYGVLRLVFSGGYSRFFSWKSAVRDLFGI